MGALTGAISGMAFAGAGAIIEAASEVGQLAYVGERIAMHAAAGAISGGINSAITGGNFGLGMLTGGISGGTGMYVGNLNFVPRDFGSQLVARTVSGAVAGGTTSEIYGGNFWQGFAQGAATAAAAFLFNETMHRYILINQSANRQVWADTQTGKQVPAPGEYVDPLTDSMRDALSTAAKAVDKFFDNPYSNEGTKAAPMLPITNLHTLLYDAYAAAQMFYKQYLQPYVRSLIRQ
jgi:hypothetical protein